MTTDGTVHAIMGRRPSTMAAQLRVSSPLTLTDVQARLYTLLQVNISYTGCSMACEVFVPAADMAAVSPKPERRVYSPSRRTYRDLILPIDHVGT